MIVECSGVPYQHKRLPEIKVKTEEGLRHLATQLRKPLLEMKDGQALDPRFYEAMVPVTKKHDLLFIIADGVMYKYVSNVQRDDEDVQKKK
jgi:hypothetical protein